MPVSKNYVTDYSADNTGATDNVSKLATFATFAQAQGTDPVTLIMPAGTYLHDATAATGGQAFSAQFFARGVNMTVQGAGKVGGPTGTTWTIPQTNSWAPPFFGSLAQQANLASSRIATVNAGSSSVFCITVAEATNFPVGRWVMITGIDLQGVIGADYGFPTNPQFFDYAKVIANNGTTGQVTLDRSLEDSYKSTWAVQYAGVPSSAMSQGGAAWMYLMHPSFEQTSVIKDIYFDLPFASTPWLYNANNTDMTIQNCTFAGSSGPSPSQNVVCRYIGCDFTNSVMEVDKIIKDLYFDSCTETISGGNVKLFFQSSSVKNLYVNNSTLNWLTGMARNNYITNSSISKVWFANSYGMGKKSVFNNSTVTEFLGNFSNPYKIAEYPMTSGVIRCRRSMTVTNKTANGSGKVRLTVNDTTDVGAVGVQGSVNWNLTGVFTNLQGQQPVTVIDGTTVDLDNITAASVTWTGGGTLDNSAQSWAIPGYYCNMWSPTNGVGIVANFQVTDQSNDANYIYINTNLSGTWPANVNSFGPHTCIDFSGTGNTGCPEIIEHSRPYAQRKPIYSCAYREFDQTWGTGQAQPQPYMVGEIKAIRVNVITPYTGSGNLTWRLSGSDNWQMTRANQSVVNLALSINAKIAGLRTITPTGNTGLQTGDSFPTLAVGDRLGRESFSSPTFSKSVNGENLGPFITLEMETDQGIVNQTSVPLFGMLRLHA